jgi:hypothetical protein
VTLSNTNQERVAKSIFATRPEIFPAKNAGNIFD